MKSKTTRTRSRAVLGSALVCLVATALVPACREADPTAPNESVLTISANPPTIPLTGTSRITVLAYRSDGIPVVDGTVIDMTTTLGEIEPKIYTNKGVAAATFQGGTISGDATISASSGALTPVTTTVKVGTSSVFLTLSASPASFPFGGGTSTLTCVAYDENTVPLANIPVQFTTDSGSLDSGGALLYTDSSGTVTDHLRLTSDAAVTCFSGDLASTTIVIDVGDPETPPPGNPPASVTVSANPPIVAPNQPSSIVATVFDASGFPLSGVGVAFSTTQGSLSSGGVLLYTNGNGQAFDTLVTTQTATVTATAGGISGTATVTVSSNASTLSLTANRGQMTACTDIVTMTATVRDGSGTGVPGVTVFFSLDPGSVGQLSVSSGTTNGNGNVVSLLSLSASDCTACSGVNCTAAVRAKSGGLTDATYAVTVNLP
ncbi:MAG: Ig-like domain-containing protein [Acidobacteriota bacterium]